MRTFLIGVPRALLLLFAASLPSIAQAGSLPPLDSNPYATTVGSSTLADVEYRTVSGTASVSIGDVSQAEGNDNTTDFVFEITLSEAIEKDVTVSYATMDGSATAANLDYVPAMGTAMISANATSATITIQVRGDTHYEDDETFTVELSDPENATIGTGTGTGTIENDDGLPILSIDDVSQSEGNAGATAFVFTLTLSNAHEEEVTVDYMSMDGSATTDNLDYTAAMGTATIPAKSTSTTITIDVIGDTKYEEDETFTLGLSNAKNATIGEGLATGTGTIENDDTEPTITIDSVTKAEGNSGTTAFDFTVLLSNEHAEEVTVDYMTTEGSASPENNDYVAESGTLTIPAKSTSVTLSVFVIGDLTFENDETFHVRLSNAVNATIQLFEGTGTIENDDVEPTVSIDNVFQVEGSGAFVFTVFLSHENAEDVKVDFSTADGSATTADADYDFKSGTALIPAKTLSTTVTIQVNDDTNVEPTEEFFVDLSNAMNAMILIDRGRGVILNDDGVVAVGETPVTEFALGRFAPNPFSEVARLDYAVAREAPVRLSVFDIQGREIVVLASGTHRPGRHQATWNGQVGGRAAPAGVYLVRYRVPGRDFVRRLAITR